MMWKWMSALVLVLVLAGCGSDTPAYPDLGSFDLGPTDLLISGIAVQVGANGTKQFSPASVTVPVGTSVTWVFDSSGHTVTSGTVDPSGAEHIDGVFCSNGQPPPSVQTCTPVGGNVLTSAAGSTYKFTFNTRGTFPYFCIPHGPSGMTGQVVVQ